MSDAEEMRLLRERVDQLTKAQEANVQSSRQMTSTLSDLTSLGSRAATNVQGTTDALMDLGGALSTGTGAISTFTTGLASVAGGLPLVGGAFKGLLDGLAIGVDAFGALGSAAITLGKNAMNLFDGPSRDIRAFDADMFSLNKRFGGTIDEASRFADSLKQETASEFSRSLYLTRTEMSEFLDATKRTNLTLEQLNKTVSTSLGQTKLYALATAAAAAMSMSNSQAAELLNTAMNKQGKSAQDAAEMLGVFAGVASETGLSADTVARTLNSAVDGFTKLGLSADFGRPMLEGFATVMDDMGLGIENATSLTGELSKSLAGLATNYSAAYVMFQRGGLEMGGSGGSGALGASIGLQAATLQADRTGDQSELGRTLMQGMRDTIASFGGGDIVTVEDAAADSSLQNQFYVQQQMLGSQFGITDQASANRVLDLLAQLDEATRSGDTDAQQKLEEQLANEREGRDETMDEWAKANANLEVQSNLLAVIAREPLMAARSAARFAREKLDSAVNTGGAAARRGAESLGDDFMNALTNFGFDPDSAAGRMLSAEPTPADTAAANRLGEETAAGDLPGVGRSARAINPNLANPNANMSQEIERAASIAASNATTSAIQEAGFLSRDDFADAVGSAIAAALSDELTVNVDLTPAASEFVQTTQNVNNQVGGING